MAGSAPGAAGSVSGTQNCIPADPCKLSHGMCRVWMLMHLPGCCLVAAFISVMAANGVVRVATRARCDAWEHAFVHSITACTASCFGANPGWGDRFKGAPPQTNHLTREQVTILTVLCSREGTNGMWPPCCSPAVASMAATCSRCATLQQQLLQHAGILLAFIGWSWASN